MPEHLKQQMTKTQEPLKRTHLVVFAMPPLTLGIHVVQFVRLVATVPLNFACSSIDVTAIEAWSLVVAGCHDQIELLQEIELVSKLPMECPPC
jgi:hypothetical protein